MALGARNNGGTYLFYTESFDRFTPIFVEHLMPIALLKDKTGREWPFGPSVPSFSSWPFAVSGMLLAGLSPLLARRLGPSRVSGTLMAVFGFVWLRINDDETTTPVVLWT